MCNAIHEYTITPRNLNWVFRVKMLVYWPVSVGDPFNAWLSPGSSRVSVFGFAPNSCYGETLYTRSRLAYSRKGLTMIS